MFGGKYGFSLLKFTLLVLALIETFTDSVISFIVYTADAHSSSILSYYIGANYLPSKQFYKVVIVLYVPALCLWRVRKQTAVKEQDLPLACSDCNYLKNRQLKPVAHVCQRIFRIVLHIRRVPSGVVNLSARSRSPLIWLQRLFNTWFRPNLSHEAVKKIRFNDSTISSGEEGTTCGNDLIRSSGVRLSNDKRTSSRGLSWGLLVNERDGRHQEVLKEYNTRLSFYRNLPLRWFSRLYGRVHSYTLPVWLRTIVLRFYIWLFNCSLEDASVQDLKQYRNLNEFFRRSLRKGIRPVRRRCELTSPADGVIVHCGEVTEDCLEQVKGVTYSLQGFMGPRNAFFASALAAMDGRLCTSPNVFDSWGDEGCFDSLSVSSLISRPGNRLYQCVVYLSPGDYHHFHSPADWTVIARRHFPGELLSVSPSMTRWIQGVFNFNERALYIGKWHHGFFSMTAVGATLVGSINVYFDKTLSTNTSSTWPDGFFDDRSLLQAKKYYSGVRLSKGQAMGDFRLGSTIVLLFEAPPGFQFSVNPGQQVKYGCGISVS